MRRVAALGLATLLGGACVIGTPEPTPTPTEPPTLRVLVGGDGTLEARSTTLATSGVRIESVDRPGAHGSVAVADLVARHAGDPGVLAMVGASVVTNELIGNLSPRLGETTPVARLGSEAFLLAVAPASPIRDATDLRVRIERDPLAVRFAGAGIGSLDHQLAALLVIDATHGASGLAYASYATTADAAGAVAGGQAQVVVGRYGALRQALAAQSLRALALSSPARLPSAEIPTLREAGFDMVFLDWALLAAPPRIPVADLAALREIIERAHGDPAWSAAVSEHAWVDDFSTEGLVTFLGTESTRTTAILQALRLIRER